MDSVDLEVLKRCAEWLDAGRRVLLVTVVKTWGSSPRPPGAMLAVRDDGQVEGSVSGGCIEDDIVGKVRADGMTATRCEVGHLRRDRRRGAPLRAALRRHDPARAGAARRRTPASARCSRAIEGGRLVARRLELESGRGRRSRRRARRTGSRSTARC